MKVYLHIRDSLIPEVNSKEATFFDISQILIQKIQDLWDTASIPTLSKQRMVKMLKDYNKKYMKIKKSSNKKDLFKIKRESFLEHAKATLFDVSYCKCKEFSSCKCSKDKKIPKLERQFIVDQRTVRKMGIGNIDITTTKQMVKKRARQLAFKNKVTKLKITTSDTQKSIDIEDEEVTPEKNIDPQFICKIQDEPSTPSGVRSSQMRKSIPTVAL